MGGKWDISNKQRIGFSEVQLVQKMIDGVTKVLHLALPLAPILNLRWSMVCPQPSIPKPESISTNPKHDLYYNFLFAETRLALLCLWYCAEGAVMLSYNSACTYNSTKSCALHIHPIT